MPSLVLELHNAVSFYIFGIDMCTSLILFISLCLSFSNPLSLMPGLYKLIQVYR